MKLTRDHVSGLVYSRTNKSSSNFREGGNNSDWTCPNPRVSKSILSVYTVITMLYCSLIFAKEKMRLCLVMFIFMGIDVYFLFNCIVMVLV